MPHKTRWAEVEVASPTDSVDAVGQGFISIGCTGYSLNDNQEPVLVRGYLPVDDRLEERLYSLKEHLVRLPEFGLPPTADGLVIRYVDEEDWATAWKAYFKPIPIGRRIVITPPWESPKLSADQIAVVIDPGMAFGTGSHATTQLCLTVLDEYVRPGSSVADIGTGSGILAIAASLLGAGQVAASDIDPLAVRIAEDNARINGAAIALSIDPPEGTFDIVVANILADVILEMKDILIAHTKPGGLIAVSGVIDTRAKDVQDGLTSSGLDFVEERQQAEWRAILFRRPTDRST